jgi:adenylate cyclase
MTNPDTLCIICCMTYQSSIEEGADAAITVAGTVNKNDTLRTVLVCDVVDSVHWMQVNEAYAIAQWQSFIEAVKKRVITKLGGRLVKSLGDGLMLEFLDVPQKALSAAFEMKKIAAEIRKADTSKQDSFWLRMALHHTTATVGEDDIYGHGVNLCARIAGLAGPGEIVISTEMRDQLTDQLDADLEDMGECFLKHIAEPIRVYRAGPVGHLPILVPQREYAAPLQAIVAVIPFAARSLAKDNQLAVGEIIADGVIGQLSRTPDLKVISRLSTSVFRHRINSGGLNGVADIEAHLGANYVLSGSYIAMDKKLIITAELTETKNNQIVWMDRLQGDVMDLLQLQSELCHAIANATHMAILTREVEAALTQPLPTLQSYSLMLGGINLIHRHGAKEFNRGLEILNHLEHLHNRSSIVASWKAMWYVLAVTRGVNSDKNKDANIALQLTKKAFEADPMNSMAQAVEGFVYLHLKKDIPTALARLNSSTETNPNDSIGWLFKGVAHSFLDQASLAVLASEKALTLSPLDPQQYYFESLAASSAIVDKNYSSAIELCKSSIRRNSMHLHTYRALVTAYWYSGQSVNAKITAKTLLQIAPNFNIDSFSETSASADTQFGKKMVLALLEAGIPQGN